MARKWSRGATKALKLIEKNRRKDLKDALKAVDDEPGKSECKGRNEAVKARVNIELWRNGFEEGTALDEAQFFAQSGRRTDKDDFYTNWKVAYSLKYCARSRGWGLIADSLAYYTQALASLAKEDPANTDALRSILIDRGETFVYMSQADTAVLEMERALALKGKPQDWHVWAYAFALHQVGQYKKSAEALKPFVTGKSAKDMYYNDVRLLLAASLARAGKTADAQAAINLFRKNRDNEGERVWTVSLELERGCFQPGGPGETHWRESLEMLDAQALPR